MTTDAIVDHTPTSWPGYHPRPPQREGEEWESVITSARLAEWYLTEEEVLSLTENHDFTTDDFLDCWDALENVLDRRRKHLERILSKRRLRLLSSPFHQQIWDRENQIANRKRLDLLEKEARRTDKVEIQKKLKNAGWNVDESSTDEAEPKKKNYIQQWNILDWLIYELNTFVPALLGLFLHSVAMAGFFEIVQCLFQKVYSTATLFFRSESPATRATVIIPSLVIGILALRCTGYLYWWLNDRDFDCLKIDYHNRLRLGYRGAQLIHSVRSNMWVRMTVYMLSYNLIYLTAIEMYYILPYIWGVPVSQRLTDLPSATAIDHSLTTDGFPCLLPCNQEIERRDAIDKMLLDADFEYTQEVLSWESHARYWLNYVYRNDFVSSPRSELKARAWEGDLAQFVLVMSICLTLMRFYGFVFWKTY